MYRINSPESYNYYITKKEIEAEKEKCDYEYLMQKININKMFLELYSRVQEQKTDEDINVSAVKDGIIFYGYSDKVKAIEGLFNDEECIKLEVDNTTLSFYRELIFLLDSFHILVISEKSYHFLDDGDIAFSANIIKIDESCIAQNFSKDIVVDFADGFNITEEKTVFSFLKEDKTPFLQVYKSNDKTMSLEGKDIRDLIKRTTLEDIITKLTAEGKYKESELMRIRKKN